MKAENPPSEFSNPYAGNLTINGFTDLNGATEVTGQLTVTNGNIGCNQDLNIDGNGFIGGTLTAVGLSTLAALTASGLLTANGGIVGIANGGLRTSAVVPTTNATVTTVDSFNPTNDRVVFVIAKVFARRSTGAQGAGYTLCATFRDSAGVVTQIGATTAIATHEDDATWNATLDTDGTLIRVRVTGVAAVNIDWQSHMEYSYVS